MPRFADTIDARYELLQRIIVQAGDAAFQYYQRLGTGDVYAKGQKHLVTEADYVAEEIILERLRREFPEDAILSEEAGGGFGGKTWVVDPIDGTTNFSNHIPMWCVSIALVSGNRTLLGGVYDPVHGDLYIAGEGRGATRNGQKIRTTRRPSLENANIVFGYARNFSMETVATVITDLWRSGARLRLLGAGALMLTYVADGRIDAFFEHQINAWDCLAGLLIVQEAGGRTTSFHDEARMKHGGGILAAGDGIFDTLSAITGIYSG